MPVLMFPVNGCRNFHVLVGLQALRRTKIKTKTFKEIYSQHLFFVTFLFTLSSMASYGTDYSDEVV